MPERLHHVFFFLAFFFFRHPNQCARQCAHAPNCKYWIVKAEPNNRCLLRATKSRVLQSQLAEKGWTHGDRDESCARNICPPIRNNSDDGAPINMTKCEESVLQEVPTGTYIRYGDVVATLTNQDRPAGAPPWSWQECSARCADTYDCVYWLLTSVHCVLKARVKGSEQTDVTNLLFHGYRECNCRSDAGLACAPLARDGFCFTDTTGRVFEDPTPLEQVFEPAVIPAASTSMGNYNTTLLNYPSEDRCAEACIALKAQGMCNAFTYSTTTQHCTVLWLWMNTTLARAAQHHNTATTPGLSAYVYRMTPLDPCNPDSRVVAPLDKEFAGLPRVLLIGVSLRIVLDIACVEMPQSPPVGNMRRMQRGSMGYRPRYTTVYPKVHLPLARGCD